MIRCQDADSRRACATWSTTRSRSLRRTSPDGLLGVPTQMIVASLPSTAWRRSPVARSLRCATFRSISSARPASVIGLCPAFEPADVFFINIDDHDIIAEGERERLRYPQHVPLAVFFQVAAQRRAAAVDLITAGEVDVHAVGAGIAQDLDRQLALGRERQVRGQPHPLACAGVIEVLTRDPLPEPDQRVPGVLADVGQVHGVDPVDDPAGASHVLAFDAGGGRAVLLLTGLIQRPDPQPGAPGDGVKAGDDEPPDHAHHLEGVPAGVVQQPLGLIGGGIPGPLRDAPAITFAQLRHARPDILARLDPRLDTSEAPLKAGDQLPEELTGPTRLYHEGSSRL